MDGVEGSAGHRKAARLSEERGGLEVDAGDEERRDQRRHGRSACSAAKKLSATYSALHEACADWADDGGWRCAGGWHVHIHTHNQNPQALRGQIAKMLGTTVDNVVVHVYAGPGTMGGRTAATRERKTRR